MEFLNSFQYQNTIELVVNLIKMLIKNYLEEAHLRFSGLLLVDIFSNLPWKCVFVIHYLLLIIGVVLFNGCFWDYYCNELEHLGKLLLIINGSIIGFWVILIPIIILTYILVTKQK